MALTKAQRDAINTRKRAQSTLARVAANGTPQQQHVLQQRVAAKYPTMKVNGTGGNTGKPTGSGAGLKSGTGSKSAAKKTAAAKPMRRGK